MSWQRVQGSISSLSVVPLSSKSLKDFFDVYPLWVNKSKFCNFFILIFLIHDCYLKPLWLSVYLIFFLLFWIHELTLFNGVTYNLSCKYFACCIVFFASFLLPVSWESSGCKVSRYQGLIYCLTPVNIVIFPLRVTKKWLHFS